MARFQMSVNVLPVTEVKSFHTVIFFNFIQLSLSKRAIVLILLGTGPQKAMFYKC